MKAVWFPPKKPVSESRNGFQNPLPRGDFRVVAGEASRNNEQFANDLFDHIELLQALPYIGAPIKEHPQLRRLLHSPLYVYYRVDEKRGAIEILHFWHSSRRDPQF
jgi:plasmid stabilization system protein ParE